MDRILSISYAVSVYLLYQPHASAMLGNGTTRRSIGDIIIHVSPLHGGNRDINKMINYAFGTLLQTEINAMKKSDK